MNIFENLLARIEKLETNAKTKLASLAYAEVTSTNPLRIKYDGQSTSEAAIPGTIIRPPLGSRVYVLRLLTAAVVFGIAGGEDSNTVVINGTAYQRSGSYDATVSGYSQLGPAANGLWYARVGLDNRPYTPPTGYNFVQNVTSGLGGYAQGSISGGWIHAWAFGWSNPGAGTLKIHWILVKN